MEKRILLVEDDAFQRRLLKKALLEFGYHVETAENGEAALEAYAKGCYPLVITDLVMPGMDGAQLCRELQRFCPRPVIYALSAHVSDFDPDNLERIGFDGYLCKPPDPTVLRRAIEGGFDKADQNRPNLKTPAPQA